MPAPSINNIQHAIEHIYPLVAEYKMEKKIKKPPAQPKLQYMPKYRNPIQQNRGYVYDSDEDEEDFGMSGEEEYDSEDYDTDDYWEKPTKPINQRDYNNYNLKELQ